MLDVADAKASSESFTVIFAAWAFVVVVAWAAPAVDLALLDKKRWKRVPLWHVFLYWCAASAVGVLLSWVLRTTVIEAYRIPGGSMLPTLQARDHIFVDKISYGPLLPFSAIRLFSSLPPARGELVVFEYPYASLDQRRQDLVKRVIAVEGDTLELQAGRPIINGRRVPSCSLGAHELDDGEGRLSGELELEFIGSISYLVWFEQGASTEREGPYRVAPGEVWVLGDNRHNSSDSRAWNSRRGAGVPHDAIKGRVSSVWLSFDGGGRVAWDRVGVDLAGEPRLPENSSPQVVARFEECLSQRPAHPNPQAGTSD